MRILSVAIYASLLALPLGARVDTKTPSDVTVILDFKGPWSQNSINEMEREAGLILKSSGFSLGWGLMGQDPHAAYRDIVVVRFRGSCRFDSWPQRRFEPGYYAFTYITDGKVMPFGEVDCERVLSAVQDAMSGHDDMDGNQLMGRALGRVVAHELVHMLTRSTQHAIQGVSKSALSPKELTQPDLPLSAFDTGRLKQESAVWR